MPATSLPFAPVSHRLAVAFSLAALLSACGGGGGGGSSSGSSSAAAAPAPAPAASAPAPAPSRLQGVAAYGAPLAGATVKIIDAKGQLVGTGSTNTADGSYAITLTTATPTLPLLAQVAGFDATGQPLVLHSAIGTLAAAATLNVTPLTDAIVALTLGTDPRKVFAQPTAYATALASLTKLTPASDFLKTIVKTNLTDAKAGTLTTLDLLGDGSFAAAKVGVDLALETLAISIGTSSTRREQLQLGNKLGAKPVEVTVDLANAALELAKATGAVPANAITSTAKVTTSPTAMVTRLPALDALAVSINSTVAAGAGDTSALTGSYVRHNGRDASALSELIGTWAQQGTQLGRLQVIGCADATAGTTCTRVAVAARLSDRAGKEVGTFSDVVTYSTTTSKWSLVGNGLPAEAAVRATAWLQLSAEGAVVAEAAPNPRIGVQLRVAGTANGATVLTPSNYVLTLTGCNQAWLCVATAGSSTRATGSVADQGVFYGSNAWMGLADTATSASYAFTLSTDSGNTSLPLTLRTGFIDAPATGRFATLDGVKAGEALSGAALLSGTTLSWKAWAAANSDMRLTQLRLVLAQAESGDPQVVTVRPASWTANEVEWAAVTLSDSFALGSVTLWLVAIDASGREYTTSYAVVP